MQPVNYKLSYWTLRFNDNAANEEFLDQQRQEIQTNAKYMLVTHAIIIGILLMLMLAHIEENKAAIPRLGFLVGMFGPPTIFLAIVYQIARYKHVFVDLFGLAYFTGYTFALVALYL